MIILKKVSKSFVGKEGIKKAIDEVSFALPSTGMVFILGDSGSGKSTLLNLIAGYHKADSGSILVDGEDITTYNEKKLDRYHYEKIGFIFQDYCLIESMSVIKNLYIGDKKTKKDEEEILEALEKVGLAGYEKRKVADLSGGEKQRLAFARALLKHSPIVLADEPCGNLDEGNSKVVLDLLKEMSKKSLVIIVSHNLDDAYHYADRVMTLVNGKFTEDVTYSSSYEKLTSYRMIEPDTNLQGDALKKASQEIYQGKIKGVYRRKDAFRPTTEITAEPALISKNIRKNPFVSAVLRLFGKSHFRIVSFAFVIAIILSIFSISFSIATFSSDEALEMMLNEQEATSIIYVKGQVYDDEPVKTFTFPMEEGDLQAIYDAGYEGNHYPLIRFGAGVFGGGAVTSERRLGLDWFRSFYPQAMGGVLLCPESFIKQNLDIDEVHIETLEGDSNDGIYITDFIADSFVHYSPKTYPTRQDVLGLYTSYDRDLVYIKGIIDTDYEERLAPLKEALSLTEDYYSFYISKEWASDFDYMRDCLSVAYYTGDDFYGCINATRDYIYKDTVYLQDSLGRMNFEYSYKYITYCTLLKDNEIMSQAYIVQYEYTGMSSAEIEEYLNEGDNTFYYRGYGASSDSYQGLDNILERSFDTFLVHDNHLEYFEDPSVFGTMGVKDGYVYVSKNVFDSMSKEDAYISAYYLDNVSSASLIRSKIESSNNLYLSSVTSSAIDKLASATTMFGNLFEFLYFGSIMIAVAIVLYYAISSVVASKYGIGVLKSQGYGGRELTLYYLMAILIFFLLSTGLYFLSYSLMTRLINEVILEALIASHRSAAILIDYSLFSFDLSLSIWVLLGLLASLLIISLVCLYILRKIRVADILRKKE